MNWWNKLKDHWTRHRRKTEATPEPVTTNDTPTVKESKPKIRTHQAETVGAFGKSEGNQLWVAEGVRRIREGL